MKALPRILLGFLVLSPISAIPVMSQGDAGGPVVVQLVIRFSTTDAVNYQITDPLGRTDNGVTTEIPDCDRIHITGSQVQSLVDLAAKLNAEDAASTDESSETGAYDEPAADESADSEETTGWDGSLPDTTDWGSEYDSWSEEESTPGEEQILLITVVDPVPGTWTVEPLGDAGTTTTIEPTGITDVGRCTGEVRTELLGSAANARHFTCIPDESGCSISWED